MSEYVSRTKDEFEDGELYDIPEKEEFRCANCEGRVEESELKAGLCRDCKDELKALLKEKYKQMLRICDDYHVNLYDVDVIVEAIDEVDDEIRKGITKI